MRRIAPYLLVLAACGGTPPPAADVGPQNRDGSVSSDAGEPTDAGASPADAGASDGAATGDSGASDAQTTPDAGSPSDTGVAADAGGGADSGLADAGSMPSIPDPEQAGPLATSSFAETIQIAASNNPMPLDCYVPTAPGSFPLILIGHGFQLPASQYTGYATHLAGFGYVACTADFQAGLIANHAENAADFIAGIDHLLGLSTQSNHPLSGKIDPTRVGVTGHSLGGKVSFLAAASDPRIGAVFGLDPVDSSMFCDPSRCPDASDMLPFSIPVGVLGETLDAPGRRACAPQADNFQTFYSAASRPAVQIDVLGAGHMSFIDDPGNCGLPCLACETPTAAHTDVIRLARAMVVAFFERHLKGDAAYDEYLTGTTAQTRYVATGLATITSK